MNVKEAIDKRYSTRYYDPQKEIPAADLALILKAGMRAPSGLGLEPWKFIVITGDRAKMFEASNKQQHIQDASLVIALVNYTKELVEDHPHVFTDKFEQSGFNEEKQQTYLEYAKVKGTQYFREQLMFAASQMSLQATELGIGSVIVGGYDQQQMGELLHLNPRHYQVGLLISFGYPNQERTSERENRDVADVVTYVNL